MNDKDTVVDAPCESCDGTGVDLYDGAANRDCQVCAGRGHVTAPSTSVREEQRNEVKRLINGHVAACLRMSAGGVIPTPLHPGPTADAIIVALKPSTDKGDVG